MLVFAKLCSIKHDYWLATYYYNIRASVDELIILLSSIKLQLNISISRQPEAKRKRCPRFYLILMQESVAGVFVVIHNIFDTPEILENPRHCDKEWDIVVNVTCDLRSVSLLYNIKQGSNKPAFTRDCIRKGRKMMMYVISYPSISRKDGLCATILKRFQRWQMKTETTVQVLGLRKAL